MSHLGQNIKFFRFVRGLSQHDLAERVDAPLTQVDISPIETGLRTADPDRVRLLAQALDVSTASLLRRPRTVSRETQPLLLADLGSPASGVGAATPTSPISMPSGDVDITTDRSRDTPDYSAVGDIPRPRQRVVCRDANLDVDRFERPPLPVVDEIRWELEPASTAVPHPVAAFKSTVWRVVAALPCPLWPLASAAVRRLWKGARYV